MERREIVAWVFAALFLVGAAVSIWTRPNAPATAEPNSDAAKLWAENKRLRAGLVHLRSEALALRAELDRNLQRLRESSGASSTSASAAPTPGGELETRDPAAIARRVDAISTDITRLSADLIGNPESFKALFQRISELRGMGSAALPAMRNALVATSDPTARRIFASALAMSGGPAEQQLLLAEAEKDSDPQTKQALLATANAMGGEGSGHAQSELRAMVASPEASTRANAIRNLPGLADADTASAVQKALATDSNESVRFAALDALMRDGDWREQAVRTALRDPSERIRAVAECRSRLADLESELAAGE